ncbi:MAG: cysteine desulfurase [Gammaproteobacteria bacterium]|nr:cysteine desulfurase [Gammaproteobacteria bacterium]
MASRAYFDHNATTPVDERVFEAMLPYLREHYGNASSGHREGRLAHQAVEQAREQVAALVKAHPSQVIFTSGGTEANNLALKGVRVAGKSPSLAVSAVEHASVLVPARKMGARILDVGAEGNVERDSLDEALQAGCRLVSAMLVNNETGTIERIAELAQQARASGALFHTDAVQAAGKIDLDMPALGVDLLSLSAHKIYGPKGVGALVTDKAVTLVPQLEGGGHEKGRRSGSLNVAAIVGFGQAAELAVTEMASRNAQQQTLREQFEHELSASVEGVVIHARTAERVANTSFASVPGLDGEALLMALDDSGFAVSSGSACDSKSTEPSHVLMAMGVEESVARGAIRISLGCDNTREQVGQLVQAIKTHSERLGSLASGW